jgi:hypothetical protein
VSGVETGSLLLLPFIGQFYKPRMIDGDDCGAVSGTNIGKPKYLKKT